jgi:hypothetical protein
MSTKATTVADFGTSNILLVAVAALAIWILIKKLTTKPSTRNKVTGLTGKYRV